MDNYKETVCSGTVWQLYTQVHSSCNSMHKTMQVQARPNPSMEKRLGLVVALAENYWQFFASGKRGISLL